MIFNFSQPNSLDDFRKYYAELIVRREEGVIVKPVDSIYQPLEKGAWMKLKKDYINGLGDTADFAVIGGRYSRVTDTKFTVGENRLGGLINEFIVGCLVNKEDVRRNPRARAEFKVVMVVEAGFKETMLREIEAVTNENIVENSVFRETKSLLPYNCSFKKTIFPSAIDVFYKTPFVVELLGGSFVQERGDNTYSLRFPRLRRIRKDITWKDCVTFSELQEMARIALTPLAPSEVATVVDQLRDADENRPIGKKRKREIVSNDADNGKKVILEDVFNTIKPEIDDPLKSSYFLFAFENYHTHPDVLRLGFALDSNGETLFVDRHTRAASTISTLTALLSTVGWDGTPPRTQHGMIFAQNDSKLTKLVKRLESANLKQPSVNTRVTVYDVAVLKHISSDSPARTDVLNKFILWISNQLD